MYLAMCSRISIPDMVRPPIQRVSLPELRSIFNEHVWPRIQGGELMPIVASEGAPDPRNNQPPGTVSQRVEYWESTGSALRKVATVHQYVRPDGSLGGSGRPDPKRVFHDGLLYAPHIQPTHR